MDMASIERAAEALVAVRQGGAKLPGLGADAPVDIAAGFAVQRAVLARIGGRIGGWKCAAPPGKDPSGAMLDSRGVVAGPVPWFVVPGTKIGIETEIAFRMGADLPGRDTPYSREEVLDAVAGCCPAVELVVSRYHDPTKVSLPEAIADSVAHDGLVFGADVPNWRDLDLPNLTVRQTYAGRVQVEKVGGNPSGDPVVALHWLANFLPSIGMKLEAGQVVTTGSCTGLLWVESHQRVVGEFRGFGAVALQLA
jgi:2-keto-4-pentenoate hydratase